VVVEVAVDTLAEVVDRPRLMERPVKVAEVVDIPVAVAVAVEVEVEVDTPVAAERRPLVMEHPPQRTMEHPLQQATGHRPEVVAVVAAVDSAGVVSAEELLPAATEHRRPAVMVRLALVEEGHRLLATELRPVRPAAMGRHR